MGVEGPEGQDFNITYSPTIPSGLNVIFHSDQDLYILKPFTYSGDQTITLSAGGSIFVQASITASHTNGKLAAHYGLSEPSVDNPHFFIVAQPINLEMGENFFSQHGIGGEYKSYQIIHELGEENSTTGTDLQGMQAHPDLNYALGRDINASATQGWRPGLYTHEYPGIYENEEYSKGFTAFSKSGDFEGLGHRIHSDLNGALFNEFSNGKISNVEVQAKDYNGFSFTNPGGMIAGSISNARIVNVLLSGELTAADSIDLNGAELYSNQLGGAFGSSTNSEIYMIGVDVRVIGRTYLGGIVGQATNTKIYSSYAAGHVYGVATGQEGSPAHSSHVGGFAGYGSSLTIEDSYSVVTVEYESGIDYGSTHSMDETDGITFVNFGGLVGEGDSALNSFSKEQYFFSESSQNTVDHFKTDAELKTKSTYTDAGWDFDKIWHIADGEYPFFKWNVPYVDQPPSDLNSTTELTVTENQPVGTIVGEFNATDPEGDAITYHFVNGENNNSLFTLDINGTLKTATTFDYESNASTYTITVQAKDELNATTEGNFTVNLLDVYEPSVRIIPSS